MDMVRAPAGGAGARAVAGRCGADPGHGGAAAEDDRRDADHILSLLLQDRFPRIWVPSLEERDVRQLLVHRHKQVQARTRVKNQLQALALGQGVQRKRKLWTAKGRAELEQLPLLPYAAQRRQLLLESLDRLEQEIQQLNGRVEQEVGQRPAALQLRTHPGVGPVTALATVLTLGPVERFGSARQVASYLGLIPREHSSGGRQQFGRLSKQGNPFLRFLLVEAGQSAVRGDAELRRLYQRLAARKHRALAKVAVARRLAQGCTGCCVRTRRIRSFCRAVMQVSPSHSVVVGTRPIACVGSLPPRGAGSSNALIMVASQDRRDGWWDPASPARLEDEPWSRSKNLPRERNGAWFRRPRRAVPKTT